MPSKTKIIVTVGPKTHQRAVLSDIIDAGVSIFRLNFSHGTHAGHAQVVGMLRSLEKEKNTLITILADLQGPKIRIGEVAEGVVLQEGQTFILDEQAMPGDSARVCLPFPEIFTCVQKGEYISLDDGRIRLKVLQVEKSKIVTEVLSGGALNSRKGVSILQKRLPIKALTDKDYEDLKFIKNLDIDYVCLSFVQCAQDIRLARRSTTRPIIAKIEKPAAIENIEYIIEEADGILIARGDLGVEVPIEKVPDYQKYITYLCHQKQKPVIVATQMLESMVSEPLPTRAEASDVGNAVFDLVDAVMLSAETAIGKAPLAVVHTMKNIIMNTESGTIYHKILATYKDTQESSISKSITSAVKTVSYLLDKTKILTYTFSGATAQQMSNLKPLAAIRALTPNRDIARKLGIFWGVESYVVGHQETHKTLLEKKIEDFLPYGVNPKEDTLIITGGMPLNQKGTTNFLYVKEPKI